MHKLVIHMMLFGVLLLMNVTWAAEDAESEQAQTRASFLDQVPSHIADHLLTRRSRIPSAPEYVTYAIKLESGQPRVEWEIVQGKSALVFGAWVYAMSTGDYEVTVQEVFDYGLIPFDLYGKYGVTKDQIICNATSRLKLKERDFDEFGSKDWLLRMKMKVLQAFFQEYYFPYKADSNFVDSLVHPDDLQAIDLFWTNIYTGEKAELGGEPGDLMIRGLNSYIGEGCAIFDDDPRLNWQVCVFRFGSCPMLSQVKPES